MTSENSAFHNFWDFNDILEYQQHPGIKFMMSHFLPYHYLNGESMKNEYDPELINKGDICWLWPSIIHDDAFGNDKNLWGRVINFVSKNMCSIKILKGCSRDVSKQPKNYLPQKNLKVTL